MTGTFSAWSKAASRDFRSARNRKTGTRSEPHRHLGRGKLGHRAGDRFVAKHALARNLAVGARRHPRPIDLALKGKSEIFTSGTGAGCDSHHAFDGGCTAG